MTWSRCGIGSPAALQLSVQRLRVLRDVYYVATTFDLPATLDYRTDDDYDRYFWLFPTMNRPQRQRFIRDCLADSDVVEHELRCSPRAGQSSSPFARGSVLPFGRQQSAESRCQVVVPVSGAGRRAGSSRVRAA